MRVSIALTTYNGAGYLKAQLQSYLEQDHRPDELVVCDDGSSDSTVSQLEDFASTAPFAVRVVRNEFNLGFTRNFEKAISLCRGDVIFFSDQDDVWLSHKISTVLSAFAARKDAMVVVHDARLVDSDLSYYGATKLGQVRSGFNTDDALVVGALTAIRSDFRSYALPIPQGVVGHDVWIHLIGRLLGVRLVLEEELQLVRRHDSNTSAWVASSVQPIGKMDVWKSQLRTEPAGSYRDRRRINESAVARVEGALHPGSPFSRDALNGALRFLFAEREALARRDRLLAKSSLGRKLFALEMFLSGDYRHFNGVRSLLRDLIR